MTNKTEFKRGFIQTSKAWYAKSANVGDEIESISIGIYSKDNGTKGEFTIVWKRLGSHIVPRLKAFDDSWLILGQFMDLLTAMGNVDDTNVTPEDFVQILLSCGIENLTQTEQP